jgi:hypothetical protein
MSVAYLEEAIPRFGFTTPITVDENYVIVTGHSRHKAALNIGLTEVPVIVLEGLTKEQINEFRIADNKVQEFSELDFDLKSDDLFDLTREDDLMSKVFGEFAFQEEIAETEDLEEEEVAMCICPECLEEFDAKKNIIVDEEEVGQNSTYKKEDDE